MIMLPIPENWNKPWLVVAAGSLAVSLLPLLERAFVNGSVSWKLIPILNAILYVLNVIATAQPGRIENPNQEVILVGGQSDGTTRLLDAATREKARSESLLQPAAWAFVIWGPIFAGELVFVITNFFLKESAPLVDVIKKVSAGFLVSQFFQVLWTASFRPKYDKGYLSLISAFMLTGICWSLNRAHLVFTDPSVASVIHSESSKYYWLCFLPLSLHFGWTTAATLVNWNGSLATFLLDPTFESIKLITNNPILLLTWIGHLSVVLGTILGVWISLSRNAPVVTGVLAWALTACAAGMQKRINHHEQQENEQTEGENDSVAVSSLVVQKWLCVIGASVCVATSVMSAFPKKK